MNAKITAINLRELGFRCHSRNPNGSGQRSFAYVWAYYSYEAYIALQFYCEDLTNIKIIRNT